MRHPLIISLLLATAILFTACAVSADPQATSVPAATEAPVSGSGGGNGSGGGGGNGSGGGDGSGSGSGQSSDAIFTVIKADASTVDFTLDDLKAIPLTSIISEGSPQEGPSVLDVLSKAGVSDFTEVTITGIDGSHTFTKAELTPEVVLDFNNRGSVKLASPDLPRDQRVRDIFEITVK